MKTLIIYAHPQTQGHCNLILNELKKKLNAQKIKFDILDLYKMGYDPLLHENELYTLGNKDVSKQNLKIQKQLKTVKNIIIIYPVWWYTMPAILKGFFDRILTSGYAFKYAANGFPVKLLKNKKAAVIKTTGGPKIYYQIFGKSPDKIIKQILGFVGIKNKVFTLYKAQKRAETRINEINKLIDKSLKYLDY